MGVNTLELEPPYLEVGEQVSIGTSLADSDYERFLNMRALYCVAAFLPCPSIALAVGQHVETSRLILWGIIATIAHTVAVITAYLPSTNARVTRFGVPFGFLPACLTTLATISSLLLFDPAAGDGREFSLAFVGASYGLTVAILAVLGTTGAYSRYAVAATVLPAVAGFMVRTEFSTASGYAVTFALVMFLLRNGRAGHIEVVALRRRVERAAENSRWAASHDGLTGLLNRSGIRAMLTDGNATDLAGALFVDLDHFKEVNDRLGHQAGDQLLRDASKRLVQAVGDLGVVARLGGDEFLVLLTNEPEDVVALGECIISAMCEPFRLGRSSARISASIGISRIDTPGLGLTELLRTSDLALYEAKRAGRNRVATYDAALECELTERTTMIEDLHELIDTAQLEFWGQPIYELETGRPESIELLARWQREDGDFVPPDVFIPLAEERGLIEALTGLAIRQAVSCLHAWQDDPALSGCSVSVNIPPSCLMVEFISTHVIDVLDAAGIEGDRLVLEVTENAAVEDRILISDVFDLLQEKGVQLALDDFGTGFSSLSELLSLPLRTVKLDRSLVNGMHDDESHRHAMVAIVDLAVGLGRDVVAEGVETAEQLQDLIDLGIGYGQGYFLCRPKELGLLAEGMTGFTESQQAAAPSTTSSPLAVGLTKRQLPSGEPAAASTGSDDLAA